MGNLLKTKELKESFMEVNAFLRNAGLNTIDHHFNLKLEVYILRQHFNGIFEIECRDYLDNESYIIYSDVFKANGYYRPVWSAYIHMTFDDSTGELEFELEGIKYILKH